MYIDKRSLVCSLTEEAQEKINRRSKQDGGEKKKIQEIVDEMQDLVRRGQIMNRNLKN